MLEVTFFGIAVYNLCNITNSFNGKNLIYSLNNKSALILTRHQWYKDLNRRIDRINLCLITNVYH